MISRLNVGCGPTPPSNGEWTSVDIEDYGQEGIGRPGGQVADITEGLPYQDEVFDLAVSHHALQIIRYVDLPDVLTELRRVLKPGGVLRISVPDPVRAFDKWIAGDKDWFPIVNEAEAHAGGKLSAYLTWYSEARTLFTRGWLCELLVRHGFRQAVPCHAGVTFLSLPHWNITALDGRPDESIYVEGLSR